MCYNNQAGDIYWKNRGFALAKSYQSIRHEVEIVLEERKSLFYGYASPVTDETSARDILDQRREVYPSANHHCSAWILGGRDPEHQVSRYSDDGEPSGTAGQPILSVLKGQDLTDVIVVVSRIFGGTLLGRGGLVSAYSGAAVQAIEAAGRVSYHPARKYLVELEYQDYERVQTRLRESGAVISDITYSDVCRMSVTVQEKDEDAFMKLVLDLTSGRSRPVRDLQSWIALEQPLTDKGD